MYFFSALYRGGFMMKIFSFFISLFPAIFIISSSLPLHSSSFPIKIDDVSGYDSPWPLIVGIPFPRGQVSDANSIRIILEGREVPSQIDVATTWQDGSIRWAHAGFTGSPQGRYIVEYGPGVKRGTYPGGLKVTRQDEGRFTVDTGAAVYEFDPNGILPFSGWLYSDKGRTKILQDSGAGIYLVDNSGRNARVTGTAAEIGNEFLKEGPGRLVLKRSGWYVTAEGEKLARAEVWLYFSAGTPYIRLTHTLVFTQDTNKVWFRDYGVEFKTAGTPADAYFALGESGKDESVKKISGGGSEIYMLQGEYPHFAEREYKAVIGKSDGVKDTAVEEIKRAGDWAYGDYGSYGIIISMPWLAERYPKEISFGKRGARAVLWSGRSGKELDFRGSTLAKEYWQSWADKALGSPGVKKLSEFGSNAEGSCRTHDMWFLPMPGGYRADTAMKAGIAASRTPLVIADPEWLCKTEAMGYPMLHKDTERFPREEALISECWKRFMIPYMAFPLTGFIEWGDFSTWQYSSVGGRIMAHFHILTNIDRYSVRREPWRLYARSGERTYYDYGHRFSRFSGDWYLIHHDSKSVPIRKRGTFMSFSPEGGKLPFAWGQTATQYITNGGDIGCWLTDYWLTGDERSLGLLKMLKESVKKNWKLDAAIAVNQSKVVRELVTLSIMDHDPDITKMAMDVARSMFDMESQNGIRMFRGSYGTMYKDHRTSHNTAEYYLETGDELAREAFLKLMDQRYRFDRRYNPISHKNYDGFTAAVAYLASGEERYRRVVEQTLYDALYYVEKYPVSNELKRYPENPLEWRSMPENISIVNWHNPLIGFPTALKIISDKGRTGKRTPVVIKSRNNVEAMVIFNHSGREDTKISFYFTTLRQDVKPLVFRYPMKDGIPPVNGISTIIEKRIQWPANLVVQPDDIYHAYITLPANIPAGLYFVSLGGNEPFTVLDITGDKVALYCPDGLFAPSGTPIQRSGEGAYGRAGEGMPLFFRVPDGLKELDIVLGSSACIRRSDGTVALEDSKENVGRISIPVEGKSGIWSIEPHLHNFRGECFPGFYRLLNVEPIVSFGSADFLPDGTTGALPKLENLRYKPKEPLEFADGVSGNALRLSSDRTLTFPLGKKIEQGGYEYFPGLTGTLEFWFRDDSTTYEKPMFAFTSSYIPFIRGPHMSFIQKYWSMSTPRNFFSRLQMSILTEKSDPHGVAPGFQSEYYFKAGEWNHVAYTWDLNDDASGTKGDLSIFVNGKKLPFKSAPYGLYKLDGKEKIKFAWKGENAILGPFGGSIDILRLSDIVRYTDDFQPSKLSPSLDGKTRALFLFDKNLKGKSAFSDGEIEMK